APALKSGRKLQIVSNAGGLNPRACAEACAAILRNAGCLGMKIGVVTGDDVLPMLNAAHARDANTSAFAHLESGVRVGTVFDRLVTANAYIGAGPVAEAILAGANIVITGRVADPSLTVGPCIAHFGWSHDDWHRLAGATIAGHLIECGTQVTGGISTDWLEVDLSRDLGYPIVEVADDGSCVVTKPLGTGGNVNARTVKEQL